MDKQVPIDDSAVMQRIDADGVHQIAADVAYKRLAIVADSPESRKIPIQRL